MGLFSEVIDEFGFYNEMKATEILEDNVPQSKLNLLMNVWNECPDHQYSQKNGVRYTANEIVEIFKKKCVGLSFAKRHVNVFAEFQLVRLKSKENK
jgi:hypothetical protein